MSRILDFYRFSKVYEAETGSENPSALDSEAKNLLDMIIYLVSSCYGALLGLTPAGEYKETVSDLTSVISANSDQKGEAIKKIITKVAAGIGKEFKDAGLDKLWIDAGNVAADAYTALVEQFKDDKEKSEAAAAVINRSMTKFIEQLKSSKVEYQTSESLNFSSLNESWFSGKRGNVNNLIKQGIVVDALLKAEASNKQLAPDVAKLQSELDGMMAKLAKLSKSKDARKEIDEGELDKMAERLTQMPFDLNKKKEQIAKSSKAFGDAASLFVKAQFLASKAYEKEKEIKSGLAKSADTKTGTQSGPIKLESTIIYDKANSGKMNSEVAKVQQLMYDKFKDDPRVSETALFKKFASFFKGGKPDGKFGPSTAGLVRALRAGFELNVNSNISQKFIDELQAHEMVKESYAARYLTPFLLEAFDYDAFEKELGNSQESKVPKTGSNPESSSKGASSAPVSDRSKLAQEVADEMEKRETTKNETELRKRLKDIGFKEIPKDESEKRADKAVGFRNSSTQNWIMYPSFQLWRSTTRKLTDLPKDAFLNDPKTVKYNDESGVSRELMQELGLKWPTYLFNYSEKTKKYIFGSINKDREKEGIKNIFEKLNTLNGAEIRTLARIYKDQLKRNLLDDLTTSDAAISPDEKMKNFGKKYEKILSEVK
jgi:peptidoglycan hydrolase-like protein with peptidoglycan-binding domain